MTRAREAARLIGNNTFRLDSNNAVGFNSTTPDAMFDINHGLTVAGVSTFTGNVTMSGDLTVQGTTTTLDTIVQEVDLMNIQANSSTPGLGVTQSGSGAIIAAYDGTSEVFRVDDGGNVGIGSDNPGTTLVLESSDPRLTIKDTDAPTRATQLRNTGGNTYLSTLSSGHIIFGAPTEMMRIQDDGQIGIGTNNPSSLLHLDAGTGDTTLNIEGGTNGDGTLALAGKGSGISKIAFWDQLAFGITSGGIGDINTESLRIDSSGRLLVSTTSSSSNIAGYGNGGIQLNSTTTAQACVNIIHRNNSANTHAIVLAKARDGGANGGRVQDDDDFGAISFQGFDGTGGTTYRQGAEIRGAVDGTPGNTDMPGRLEFLTTPDGSATPTERLRIDSSGRMLLNGGNGARANMLNSTFTSQFQIEGTGHTTSSMSMVRNTNDGGSPYLTLGKSRSTSANGAGLVSDDDGLGVISWQGGDGSNLIEAAAILAQVDGTAATDDMPGRLVFYTTADGAAAATERMRITSTGLVRIPDNGKFTCGAGDDLLLYHDGSQSYIAGDDIRITNKAVDETMAKFFADGAVELNHNDSKKFETTSTGVTVTGDVNSTSDINLKKDIEVVTSATEMLNQLRGVKFTWKENDEKSVGVIAQEVEATLPELVKGEEGDKSVNYSGLVGVLIEAVKELSARVEELENR